MKFPLHVPLLAECIEDIIPLAEFMLDAANRELGRSVKGFDREVQKRLKAYSWPGKHTGTEDGCQTGHLIGER